MEEEEMEDDEEEIVEEEENDVDAQPAQGGGGGSDKVAGPSVASGSRPLSPHPPPHMTEHRSKSPLAESKDGDSESGDDLLDPVLSPMSGSRPFSRSPPASRHTSRSPSRRASSPSSSLADRTASLSLSRHDRDVRERVALEASKLHVVQKKKYHSKRSAQRVGGRQKGSKAKLDTRVKPDRGGLWD